MPPPTTLHEQAQIVDGSRLRVWEDEFQVIHLKVDDEEHEDVRAARVFPISEKAPFISFLDTKGKEIVLLNNLESLDEESRRVVSDLLRRKYFVPKIIRVFSITETWGVSHWEVETDCGYASFEVTHRERIRKLPGNRLIITDADDNRYEIEDMTELDPQSQRLILSET